jgi:hypothetical protein
VSDWKGRRVRTLNPLNNRSVTVPAGALMTVRAACMGLMLESDECGHCGARFLFRHVLPSDVEEVI